MSRPAATILATLLATALAGVLLTPLAAAAGEPGTFTIQFENDRVAKTDRHYTHGTRIAWVSDGLRDQLPWARDALEWLYPFKPNADARVGVALGQNIYTPDDIAATGLIVNDRPYAGWLYAGISLHVEANQSIGSATFDVLDTMELDLGVVGSYSLAEETQTFVHDLINVQRPNGWDNQLDNEPGVVLVLERKWRSPSAYLGPIELDALPHAAVSLGNVSTEASAGLMLRVGQGLKADYGPPHIRPSLSGLAAFNPDRPISWYLFAGAGGRVVGHNIFLDGNTFSDSHSVDKRYLVGDAQAGAVVMVERVRLSFSYVFRTREFEGQPRADRYGGVSLSVRF